MSMTTASMPELGAWKTEATVKRYARFAPEHSQSCRPTCYVLGLQFRRKLRPKRRKLLKMVAKGGIEPPTHGFSVRCSTN
jgi:hypothetical protein